MSLTTIESRRGGEDTEMAPRRRVSIVRAVGPDMATRRSPRTRQVGGRRGRARELASTHDEEDDRSFKITP